MKITKLNDINAKVKSNTELLNNIFKRLDTEDAASINVRAIERDLDILQERAPLDLPEDLQEQSLRELMEKHPELNRKSRKCLLKRVIAIAGIAAALAAVFATAAFASKRRTEIKIYGDRAVIVSGGDASAPSGELGDPGVGSLYYASMREALDANGMEYAAVLTWVPEDFELLSVSAYGTPTYVRVETAYKAKGKTIKYSVTKYCYEPGRRELLDYGNDLGTEERGGVVFEIQKGYNQLVAQAVSGDCVYSIRASVNYEELSLMLDSLR